MARPSRALFPVLGVGLVAGALAGAGCAGGYSVEIRNESGRQVIARIVRDRAFDSDQVLEQAAVPDGQTVEMGPVSADPMERVSLRVSRPGDIGDVPNEHRLKRGYNAFVVGPGSSEDWSGFVVSPVAD